MHRTLSGWEYYILLLESQSLIGNRLSKAYETDIRQFRLDFGKTSLIIGIGEYFYLSQNPPKGPDNPASFAMLMRKLIGGKFLDSFKQYKNDRIYILEFSNGHKLILEQFAQGNLFLVDSQNKIIRPYSFKPTSKKIYNVGDEYVFVDSPPANLLCSASDWKKFSKESGEKKIGSALGKLSFGKIYSGNLLTKLEINADTPVSQITVEQANKIVLELVKMQKSPDFLVLRKGDAQELSLLALEGWEIEKKFDSFSLAVEHFSKLNLSQNADEKSPTEIRLDKRLEEQKRALKKTDVKISEILAFTNHVKENMAQIDSQLISAREKGEKKFKVQL